MQKRYSLHKSNLQGFFAIFLCLFFICATSFFYNKTKEVSAATIEELQKSIQEKSAVLDKLNQEIKALNTQIDATTKEGKTLQSTIKTLDVSQNKLSKEISVTETKIDGAALTIDKLGIEIQKQQGSIVKNREAIADIIKKIQQSEDVSFMESLLTYDNINTLWDDIETLKSFQVGIKDHVQSLEELKAELEQKKIESENQKKELTSLKNQLDDQKRVVENNKKEKTTLLTVTKNKEINFKKQLAEKQALSEAFQKDISNFEAQIRIAIDPKSIPSANKGILKWPLENIKITQSFGMTAFAKITAAYNGKGHNGVDFGASTGTKIMAALSGVVEGTGNTDIVPGCYSYGKWVLIKHGNGLSTLYAHLSLISVIAGQTVNTGSIIGYSGSTGYATGPHLHFTVYASQGVKIIKYENSVNCKNAIIPVADQKAYLDPMIYL